jgi:hypothetical protein
LYRGYDSKRRFGNQSMESQNLEEKKACFNPFKRRSKSRKDKDSNYDRNLTQVEPAFEDQPQSGYQEESKIAKGPS